MDVIGTDRLELVSLGVELLEASVADRIDLVEDRLCASVPPEWKLRKDLFEMRLDQLRGDPRLENWLVRAIVHRQGRRVVGHAGFHTAPNPPYLAEQSPGAVEFGYSVFPEYRRQGIARETGTALMRWAAEQHAVRRFVLSISPENVASLALARGWGFRRIGSQIDDIDGPEDVFELEIRDGAEPWDGTGRSIHQENPMP